MKRRDFIFAATTAALAAGFTRSTAKAAGVPNTVGARPESIAAIIARSARGARPRVLLRSSWQSIDTGDVAHTPGALRLLERHIPNAEITLWPQPGRFSERTREMLGRIFPRLQIVEGDITPEGKPNNQALADAWERSDFFLHSSGSSLVARAHLAAWRKATHRPYGVYSITVDPVSFFTGGQNIEGGSLDELEKELRSPQVRPLDASLRALFDEAAFLYCRDTLSLAYLQSQKVKAAILGFGPDTVFSWDIQNRAKAQAYLAEAGLKAGKFLCVVPRLRYTPYHKEYRYEPTVGDRRKEAVAERWAEPEAVKMADIMTRWVRTGNQVVITPEFPYEIEVGERWFNKLAADVRRSVIRRTNFWSPDEQSGVFAEAQAVVSIECHSPMLALSHGVPTIYLRHPTDTIKGQMWRDLGFGDWFAEIDQISAEEIWARLEGIRAKPDAARDRAFAFMARARARQDRLWS